MGLGAMEHCLVAEEFSRGWMSVGSIMAQGNAMAVSMSLSQQLKDEYFPKMAKGEMIGCGSISEPGVGSDVASARCKRGARTATPGSSPATNTGAPSPTAPTS